MKTAAAYIRVSTDDQIEYSPESQRKAIMEYAGRNGCIVPEEFIFSDEGISGRSAKRPAFQQMIGLAKTKPKPFDVILVWKFSRFARNREDSIVYKSMLRKQCGIDVVSISEQIGEDKTSILIEALLEAMDEYYSINLAEEVVRGMSEKARHGGVMGSLAYGYRSEHGRIVIDEEAAPVVRKVFADFNVGVPIRQIANSLNDSGLRTRMGNLWDNRGVEYMLRNIFYIGKTHWTPGGTNGKHAEKLTENTIISENSHEPLIPEEVFSAAQERVAELKRRYVYKAHPHHGKMFALKGLVRCSDCGATLVRSNSQGLQCHNYSTGKCRVSHYISLSKINSMVFEKLEADFKNGTFSAMIRSVEQEQKQKADNALLTSELSRLSNQLRRVREAYAAGVDTLDEYKENKAHIQSQIDSVRQKIQPDMPAIDHEHLIEKLKSAIWSGIEVAKSDAPDSLKNDVLRSFIHSISFDRKNGDVEISYTL